MTIRIPWLGRDPESPFPPAERALSDPEGLLAVGGDLTTPRLVNAYRHGIFPWFNEGEPILWWSPDPRAVIPTDAFHVARRFARFLKHCRWQIRVDQDFDTIVARCAAPRHKADGTWITASMRSAYGALHRAGHAHCVGAYDDGVLVGGVYGVDVGAAFSAESMFSAVDNGSKVALWALCRLLRQHGVPLLDAQLMSPHIVTLGAIPLPRKHFLAAIGGTPTPRVPWDRIATAIVSC